jgi:hypothetical protein
LEDDTTTTDSPAPEPNGRYRLHRPLARAQRSRITNGKRLLPTVHPQSVWARLMRDTMDALVSHLGGPDNVSETQRMAIRRVALLEVELVHFEDQIGRDRCEGGVPDPQLIDLYCRVSNAQRRYCEHLGWQRVPRDATPDIDQYIRAAAKPDTEA